MATPCPVHGQCTCQPIIYIQNNYAPLPTAAPPTEPAPATEGLVEALAAMGRRYESSVLHNVMHRRRPPPNQGVPPGAAAPDGALGNSIVFNANGVGFLVDPRQLTSLFPDGNVSEVDITMELDEHGNWIVSDSETDQGEPPRLTQAQVDELPHFTCRTSNGEACAICQSPFTNGDTLTQLPCDHMFHRACVVPWLTGQANTCPSCRKVVDVIESPPLSP